MTLRSGEMWTSRNRQRLEIVRVIYVDRMRSRVKFNVVHGPDAGQSEWLTIQAFSRMYPVRTQPSVPP